MPSAAPRPYIVEPPLKPVSSSAPQPAQKSFDPLLVLRAAAARQDQQASTAAAHTGAASRVIRRRGSLQQGRALEMLGHAVEYLIDSRMFELHEQSREPEAEAVQILMRLSRSVFNDCPEVVTLRMRLSRLLRLVR